MVLQHGALTWHWCWQVVTPADLGKGYFPMAYGEGARVHSDSWGSSQVRGTVLSAKCVC